MNEAVLKCEGLTKVFHQGKVEVPVLSGVDLAVLRGERVAIVGASGSGKSTLLHLLGGLDTPSQGEVWVNNLNMAQLNEVQRGRLRNQSLGFIYQFHHLLPEFTALENVAMPLLIRGTSPTEASAKARVLLENVGLGARLAHKPGELSGGERQRAAVARALVTQPQCVLADEPTGNLDVHTADDVFAMLAQLVREDRVAALIATHNMEIARRMDRVVTIRDGVLAAA